MPKLGQVQRSLDCIEPTLIWFDPGAEFAELAGKQGGTTFKFNVRTDNNMKAGKSAWLTGGTRLLDAIEKCVKPDDPITMLLIQRIGKGMDTHWIVSKPQGSITSFGGK